MLINNSDQLLILKKAFLLPRPSDSQSAGICLRVYVTVTGRVTDSYHNRAEAAALIAGDN